MIDRQGPYQTRDGRPAYVNAITRTHCKGFIYGKSRSWELWNRQGQVDPMSESPRDLVNEQRLRDV